MAKILLRATALLFVLILGMTLHAQVKHLPFISQPKEKSNESFLSFVDLDTTRFAMKQIGRARTIIPKTQVVNVSQNIGNVDITINVDYDDKPYLADMFGACIILVSEDNQVISRNVTDQALFTIVPGNYDVIMYTSDGFACYYVIP